MTPLRKIRLSKGKTLKEVSCAVGSDIGNLSRIERGKQSSSVCVAAKLASYYGNEISEMEILYPERFHEQCTNNAGQ